MSIKSKYGEVYLITFISMCTADFCTLNYGKNHIACVRKKSSCNLHTVCPNSAKADVFTDEYSKMLLEQHNLVRNKIALGRYKGQDFVLKRASNMRVFSYDMALEFNAQCYTNLCRVDKDYCISTLQFQLVSQNKFPSFYDKTYFLNHTVSKWFSENDLLSESLAKKLFESQLIESGKSFLGALGKYRGATTYNNMMSVTCNYGPSGNIDMEAIYKIGKACTECPKVVGCNLNYPGLYGDNIRFDTDDKFGTGSANSVFKKYYIYIYSYIL